MSSSHMMPRGVACSVLIARTPGRPSGALALGSSPPRIRTSSGWLDGRFVVSRGPAPDPPRQAPGCRVFDEVRVRSEMGP